MRQRYRWMIGVALASGLAGCKHDAALKQEAAKPEETRPVARPLDPATLGAVAGVVKFVGKPPARIPIDMSQDPACGMSGEGAHDSEQYVVQAGALENVYVYVKSGPAAAMNAPAMQSTPVVMDQKGCRYLPHVIAVMQGGAVEFRNSDITMHNIHTMPDVAGQKMVDVSQGPKGAPQVAHFDKPEVMMPVRCNNHPWMNAFVNVSATPFFALTDSEGKFLIQGLPAGDYVLGAVQEKMGEQTMPLTVQPHQTAKADFSYSMQ